MTQQHHPFIPCFIPGAAGRMGRLLVAELVASPAFCLTGATVRPKSPFLGQDAGKVAGIEYVSVPLVSDPHAAILGARLVIDFTNPDLARTHAALAAQTGAAYLCGTTGLDTQTNRILEQAARHVPVLVSANTSLGVLVLTRLVREAAALLDTSWDIEIMELHHNHKRDAPSGTALALGQAAATGRKTPHERVALPPHHGTNQTRPQGGIGYASLRGGDHAGEHSVFFAGLGERLELTHRTANRAIFAKGALKAGGWLCQQKAGLYQMDDVFEAV